MTDKGPMLPYMSEASKPGYTLFDVKGHVFWWRDCATATCGNQVCTWLSNTLCHPCVVKKAATKQTAGILSEALVK